MPDRTTLDYYRGRNRPYPESPMPVGYELQQPQQNQSGLEQAPNYGKLSRTERWIGRHLPGFAESKVGQALARFNESWAGKALQYLDIGAETVERGTGFLAQLAYAAGDNEQSKELGANLKAAWYAGSLAADMANFTPRYNQATNKYEIPWDLPGIEGVVDARHKIEDLVQQGVDPSGALAQVRDEYYNSEGALALRSQMQDTFFHIFADPINIIMPMLRPVERTAEMRQFLRGGVLSETVQEVAQEAQHIKLGISVTERQLAQLGDEAGDAERIIGLTSHLNNLREELPIIEDGLKFARANQLTPFQEHMVSVFNLLPDAELPKVEEMSKLGRLAYRLNPFALTPGSRAYELMNTVLQRLQTTVFHSGGGPNEWLRVMQRGAAGLDTPELAHTLLTIEGRSIRAALAGSIDNTGQLVGVYNKLQEFESPFLRHMAEILGTSEDKIIRRIADEEHVSIASQYMQKLMSLAPEERAPVELLMKYNNVPFTEEGILNSVGKLEVFKNFVGWNETMMQFEVANSIIDGIQKMALSHFGLKSRGTILQMADALKAAESLAFLKMNPAYPLRNWMNNFFTTIGRGTFGNPFKSFTNFFAEHGLPEPPRLRSGVGMAGEIDFTAAAERTLTASLEHGSEAIRRVENPQKGWIGSITRFFQRRKGLGFGEVAQTFERQASVRAYTAGFIRHYRQTNRVGKGITSVEEFSPELARLLGRKGVQQLEKGLENAYTHADIDALVQAEKNLNLNLTAVLDDASARTGLDIDNVLGPDFTEFVKPGLEEAMRNGEASVRAEMAKIRSLIRNQIESHVDEVNLTILKETAARADAEGLGAVPPVFAELMDDSLGTDVRHATDMARIGEDIRALTGDSKKAFWDNLLGDNEEFYNRFWGRSEKYIDGIEEGFNNAMDKMRLNDTLTPELEKGMNDVVIELRSNFEKWRDGWQGYYEYRNEAYKGLRRFRNEDNFMEAYNKLQLDLDRRYKKLVDAEQVHMGRMDEVISRGLPETQRNMFLHYRGKILDIRREMRQNVLDFRRAVRDVPAGQRAAVWQEKFWPERLDILKRLETAERDMHVAMQGNARAQHVFGLTEDEASKIGGIQRRFLNGEDLATEETALLNRVRANIHENPEIDALRTRWGTYSKRQMQDYFTDVQSDIRGTPVLDEGIRQMGVGAKVSGGEVLDDLIDQGARDVRPETRKWIRDWAEENNPAASERLLQLDDQIRNGTKSAQQQLPASGTFLQRELPKVEKIDDFYIGPNGVPDVYTYMLDNPDDTLVFRYRDPTEAGLTLDTGDVTGKNGGVVFVHKASPTDRLGQPRAADRWQFRFSQINEGADGFGVPMGHYDPPDDPIFIENWLNDHVMNNGMFTDPTINDVDPYSVEFLGAIKNPQRLPVEDIIDLQEQRRLIESNLLNRLRNEYLNPSEALKLWAEGKITKSQFLRAANAHPDDLERVHSLTQWQLREQGVTVVKSYYNAEDLATAKINGFDRLTLDRSAAQRPRIGFGEMEPGQVLEIEVPVENVLIHPSAHPGMGSDIVLGEDGIKGARIVSIDGHDLSTPEFNALLDNNPDIAGAPATMSALTNFHGIVPKELLLGKGIDELWFNRGASAIDAIEQSAIDATNKPAIGLDIPDEMKPQLMGYLEHAKGEQSRNLYASYRMGEWHRDSALLNYNRRMNYNNWLGAIVPYEFWATNTAFRWAMHSIDRPGMLTNFLRIRKFLATAFKPESGFPSRLQGTIRVPIPFMPEWMGQDVFIDPLRTALPFDQFAYGIERAGAQKKSDVGKAERVLEELHNDGKISDQDFQEAMSTHKGAAWERAISLGQQDDSENRLDAFDTVSMMLSPHAPIMWAHNIARGTPEQISPFLPITRSIKGISALLGVSPATGGLNPEASIRKALGLPAFDQWDDYRIDRMLSNMAATGEYSVNEVKRAMIDRQGEIFIEARRRAGIEYGVGALGSALAMPTKAYPQGEEHLRELRDQYEEAWKKYENGQIGAVNQFYNDHPEYESRLALWKNPEERLRNFLVGELWDRWNNMPQVNKDEVKNHLGDLFQGAFLDKQTRATDSIDLGTLQYWVSIMGGDPPGKMTLSPNAPPLELTDKDTAYRVQVFYDARERMFDYYNKVAPLQNDYYKLQEGAARRTFRRNHPELVNYWEWRRDFMKRNPELAPFITDNPDQLPKYSSEQELRQVEQNQPSFRPEEWENYLGSNLYRLVLDDAPLPPTAARVLQDLGVDQMTVRNQILAQLP